MGPGSGGGRAEVPESDNYITPISAVLLRSGSASVLYVTKKGVVSPGTSKAETKNVPPFRTQTPLSASLGIRLCSGVRTHGVPVALLGKPRIVPYRIPYCDKCRRVSPCAWPQQSLFHSHLDERRLLRVEVYLAVLDVEVVVLEHLLALLGRAPEAGALEIVLGVYLLLRVALDAASEGAVGTAVLRQMKRGVEGGGRGPN